MPFGNSLSLGDHFKKHGSDFPAARTAAEYEALADKFMAKPLVATLLEGKRQDGRRVRFDSATRELCVVNRNGEVLTFYRVDRQLIVRKGGTQKYFAWECRK